LFRILVLYAFFVQCVVAQDAPIIAESPKITVLAKTPVLLEFSNEVSSKTAVIGAPVQFLLAEDLLLNEKVVIPKGTMALGEIIHAQKSGFGGKAGELILAARYLLFNDQRIKLRSLRPIAGNYVGKNNTDASFAVGAAAAAAVPILGILAPFITGGEIIIPSGTRATALIAVDTPLDVAVVGP
jgi:hypothetical protein